jgi:hypothetical protein
VPYSPTVHANELVNILLFVVDSRFGAQILVGTKKLFGWQTLEIWVQISDQVSDSVCIMFEFKIWMPNNWRYWITWKKWSPVIKWSAILFSYHLITRPVYRWLSG